MNNKSYSYKQSFTVELTFCEKCTAYYNKNEKHTCNAIPIQHVDITEQLMENTRPKKRNKKVNKYPDIDGNFEE